MSGGHGLLNIAPYRAASMRVYRLGTREHDIMNQHWAGKEPSRIDREMLLPQGTAHDVVVKCWALTESIGK